MATEQLQESLKALHIKRGTVKGLLTKFQTYLDSYETREVDAIQLRTRLLKAEELWSQFFDIHNDICMLVDEPSDTEESEIFQEKYFNATSMAKRLLSNKFSNELKPGLSGKNDPNQSSDMYNQVRLPQITLPSFSGTFEEWIPFYETFDSLINSNQSLSKVQKFHYLKSCLKDEASHCVQELQISASNYDIAWSMLKERFDNKRIIIKKHIEAIDELSNCTQENHNALRHVYDTIQKHTRALKSLKRPVEQWDDWLVYMITKKIDKVTNKEWEASMKPNQIPTFQELLEFLSHKCNTLEAISKNSSRPVVHGNVYKFQKYSTSHVSQQQIKCPICKGGHSIYQCPEFVKMSIDDRIKHAKSAKLYLNCLRAGHQVIKCTSSSCKKCSSKHNTLLHLEKVKPSESNITFKNNDACEEQSQPISSHTSYLYNHPHVVLSTALIKISDNKGIFHQCRALLDSASHSHFITHELARKLNVKQTSVNIPVSGIGQVQTKINKVVRVKIKSLFNQFSTDLQCLVLDNITNDIPSTYINRASLHIPQNLKLADPEFNRSRRIDFLIGAEIFWRLLCVGQVKIDNSKVIMQETQLGWIVSGALDNNLLSTNNSICNLAMEQTLDLQLTKFWQLEECVNKNNYSIEERACEEHFLNNYRRNDQCRFVVKLPLRDSPEVILGDSKESAIKRFYALERKLSKQPALKEQYVQFINEYLSLGHMQPVYENDTRSETHSSFYLPHHAVIKNESLTTKLRVVFDASAKSTSGKSLNDMLMVGPTVQEDLFSIICRFRTHNIVLTADIAKMYRQVLVDESQQSLQRIIWRSDPANDLQTYQLTTLTYGTASAAFLATRVLKQLAIEETVRFPAAAKVIQRDFYVDDLLTGADNINDIQTICREVNTLLESGGFQLRKWRSNNSDLLNKLFRNAKESALLCLDKDDTIKTLGLQWNSTCDSLQYTLPSIKIEKRSTKRSILSHIAQIFDPLGLISPVIIKAKMMMQILWQLKVSWDESVPLHIHNEWTQYHNSLGQLNSLKVSLNAVPYKTMIDLHGFCDASEKAYGACIYVRTVNRQGQFSCDLLCSKSKVAPIKPTTTPRLELCAALLLARLMQNVIRSLDLIITNVYYWTDSTIVLAWIRSVAIQLKTFVANRVGEIQDITETTRWHHISTKENPADILSRGSSPEDLSRCRLWWHGPEWLFFSSDNWPQSALKISEVELLEKRSATVISNVSSLNLDLFHRYSSFTKLQRILSYCRRFIRNSQMHIRKSVQAINTGVLTVDELNSTTVLLVKAVQAEDFTEELQSLKANKRVYASSKLKQLDPFLDSEGIIRVGGRIRNSLCSYDEKHPMILPSKHEFTRLLIQHTHRSELHGGTQTTLAKIYSDNGSNFVKANKDLRELRKIFTTSQEFEKVSNCLSSEGISWHFIPPRAPNFGGLWEAAVKSFKYHFKRVVGNASLTYEELYTVCTQIEAILNPLSEDPNDTSTLTPSHFLIGDSLRSNLEPSLTEFKLNRLSRLQHLQRFQQHFWQVWSKEYLHTLQQRSKWLKSSGPSPQVGQLVVVREDNVPPMFWPTGRIVNVHTGSDGVVRAVSVRMVKGVVKGPAGRLCILPRVYEVWCNAFLKSDNFNAGGFMFSVCAHMATEQFLNNK